jgi:hypothetical protein
MSSSEWTWSALRSGYTRTGPLWLDWEVDGSAMSDDYSFEDANAVDLWDIWAEKYAKEHGDLVPIFWSVSNLDLGTFEAAPFQVHPYAFPAGKHFLRDFTWPVSAEDGSRLNWLQLPVVDKRWTAEQTDKGGFISEALGGWKPSPLQPMLSISALARCAHLGFTPGDHDPANGMQAHLEARDAAVMEVEEVLVRLKKMRGHRRELSTEEQLNLRSDAARLARVAQSLYYVTPDGD